METDDSDIFLQCICLFSHVQVYRVALFYHPARLLFLLGSKQEKTIGWYFFVFISYIEMDYNPIAFAM